MLVKTALDRTGLVDAFVKEPLAKTRSAACRAPNRCRIGLYSGTLPLVK
jgi:hypothetical protein